MDDATCDQDKGDNQTKENVNLGSVHLDEVHVNEHEQKCEHTATSCYEYIFGNSSVVEQDLEETRIPEVTKNKVLDSENTVENSSDRDSVPNVDATNTESNAGQSTGEIDETDSMLGSSWTLCDGAYSDKESASKKDNDFSSNDICYIFDKNELLQKRNNVQETEEMKVYKPSEGNTKLGEVNYNAENSFHSETPKSEECVKEASNIQQIDCQEFDNLENSISENKTSAVISGCVLKETLHGAETRTSTSRSNMKATETVVNDKTEPTKDSVDEELSRSFSDTSNNKQFLNLSSQCPSPGNDGRGVSPEIICLTHLSPTTLYGKDSLALPNLLSGQENLSRPSSLNTPDPVVFGDSDSSCPTPFIYTTSECQHVSSEDLYSISNENPISPIDFSGSTCQFSEDTQAYGLNCVKGQKRKLDENPEVNFGTDYNNNKTNSANSNAFVYSSKTPEIGQMYQYQGRPPDISTWTAVNAGSSKYGTGFETRYGQNYINNYSGDPYLFSYQQYAGSGYNSTPQRDAPFSSKPTCTVPPYLQSQSLVDVYSAYNQSANYRNQQFLGSQLTMSGRNSLNIGSDSNERTRASCQFASNQGIDCNNNITSFSSNAAYRLDFSSPVNQEPYHHAWPVPTFVTTPSYLNNLSRPEPVFPAKAQQTQGSYKTATCTSTYSRPSSAMSTHSDETNTPSLDVPHDASEDEEAETETNRVEATEESDAVSWSSSNVVVPVKARNIQMKCSLTDLKSKTVKDLIKTAENKSESDGETSLSVSTESASSPPPAHQRASESFAAEFIRQRKTKSPISAFCAALDLSKPKKKDRPILPYPSVEPAIPVAPLLNMNGPTLAFSGSMMVPYIQTVNAASAHLSKTNTATIASLSTSDKRLSSIASKMPCAQTNSHLGIPPNLTLPSQSALMNFDPYTCNFSTLATPLFPFLSYMEPVTTLPLNQTRPPNINLSNIPLPLYNQLPQSHNQLPQSLNQTNQNLQASVQSQTNNSVVAEKSDKQFLCQRNLGETVSDTSNVKKPVLRKEANQSKKKSDIPPPVAPIGGYTASIQGNNMFTSGPDPPKDAVTYYPVPSRKPEFACEDAGKKVFKARHCNFAVLRIGNFQYTCPTISYEKIARVKFLYSKKKMLYEFQLNDLESANVTPHRRLTEVEVPFNTVVGLWLYDKEMRLEVNTAPTMCLGSKILEKHTKIGVHAPAAVYDRHQMVDLTNGEMKTVPYHYIQFRSCYGQKLKSELCQFDGRFSLMLKSPLIEDPHKFLRTKQEPYSHLLDPLPPSGKPKGKGSRSKSSVGCKCETGCSSDLCMCCVRGGTCTEGECLCINCRNPLNILHQLGLPVHRARTDPCLMENIYQIKKLEAYVKIQLVLDCCQISLTLLQCIPGTFTCPSIGCGIKYSYSWCCAHLCNEETEPRNHCVKCGRCTDYRNQHCEVCNICYFAGESGTFKCPVCHNGYDEDTMGMESSSDTDC